MKKRSVRAPKEDHWITVSDLMTVLFVVFLLITVSSMKKVMKELNKYKEIQEAYKVMQSSVFSELNEEFSISSMEEAMEELRKVKEIQQAYKVMQSSSSGELDGEFSISSMQAVMEELKKVIEIQQDNKVMQSSSSGELDGEFSNDLGKMLAVMEEFRKFEESRQYNVIRSSLFGELEREFSNDLGKWNAIIDKKTLTVRFNSPEVLFEKGKSEIRPAFREILDDFFPRYLNVLTRNEHWSKIVEVRIEGHTSSEWTDYVTKDEAYLRNMNLSQGRTSGVLNYLMRLNSVANLVPWIKKHVVSMGYSSSRLIMNEDSENRELSRRVEFRLIIDAQDQNYKLLETID